MVDRVDLARALRVVNCPVGRPFDLLEAEERDEWLKESDEIIKWLPARHVAPPEPVVLTEEEIDGMAKAAYDRTVLPHMDWYSETPQVKEIYRGDMQCGIAWLAANGFALMRTTKGVG